MSNGNAFLSGVEDELTLELKKDKKLSTTYTTTDAVLLEAKWRSVAKNVVTLMVLAWFAAVEEAGHPTVVKAKEAWDAARTRADLPGATGLNQTQVTEVEEVAWRMFAKTPALAETAILKSNDQMYMLRRTGNVITAQHFPAE